jgi:hypothetical protein
MKDKTDVIADAIIDISCIPDVSSSHMAQEIVAALAEHGYSILRDINNDRLPINFIAAHHDSPEYACGLDAALQPAN